MANFYSQWYKQSVCQRNLNKEKYRCLDDNDHSSISENRDIAVSTLTTELLTAAQVTVSRVQDTLVYNLELKPWDTLPTTQSSSYSSLRSREPSVQSYSTTSSSSSSGFGFYSENGKSRGFHNSNRSRQHTRTISNAFSTTSSNISQLSKESLWDDWIVKFISNDDGAKEMIGGDSLEEWIFDTKNLSQGVH
ncbi:8226_t:CDS:1 [Ambispora leptoticha]|uniref:8226_t:CDS:1 n=1 Tax=Ambispora leptoticha TaxID=144679 RepID=A0A9N8ZB10_9GLOM|nr:8226_t:CDS:1 [Ambispora leptoticha]